MANPSIPWSRGSAPLAERPVWTSTLLTPCALSTSIAALTTAWAPAGEAGAGGCQFGCWELLAAVRRRRPFGRRVGLLDCVTHRRSDRDQIVGRFLERIPLTQHPFQGIRR